MDAMYLVTYRTGSILTGFHPQQESFTTDAEALARHRTLADEGVRSEVIRQTTDTSTNITPGRRHYRQADDE